MEGIPAGQQTQDATESSTAVAPAALPPPRLATEMLSTDEGKRLYWDRSHYDSPASQMKALKKSSTLYVGNLSFRTRSRNIRAHFSQIGQVQTIHLGLDRLKKTPCGFCFVQFDERKDALIAVAHLSGTKLDGNVIRVELDAGFQPGRQYGRGVSGGQVRDDRRQRHQKRGREQQQQIFGALSTPRGGQPSSTRGGGDAEAKDPEGEENEVDSSTDRREDEAMEPSAKRQRTF